MLDIDRIYPMLQNALKITGSYDPEKTLPLFQESLTFAEFNEIVEFLEWVNENPERRGFGSGNYAKRFYQFKNR